MALISGAAEAAPLLAIAAVSMAPTPTKSFNCILVHPFCDSGLPPAKPIAFCRHIVTDCHASGRVFSRCSTIRSNRSRGLGRWGIGNGVTSARVGPLFSDRQPGDEMDWSPLDETTDSVESGQWLVPRRGDAAMRRAADVGEYDIDGPAVIGPGSPPEDGSCGQFAVQFHVSTATVAGLTRIADARGVTVSDLCRQVVSVFVSQQEGDLGALLVAETDATTALSQHVDVSHPDVGPDRRW